jgi:alpha-galactosidase
MIHFNPQTKTFNLILHNSYYAFQLDDENRPRHLGWGPRPHNSTGSDLIRGEYGRDSYPPSSSFAIQLQPDEILTFGDVTGHHVTLKANFPTLPRPLEPGEAAHLPVRDLRLRYDHHDILSDARPGLAPAHGIPTQSDSERQTLRLTLKDPLFSFVVHLYYRLTPEYDIIERWCELENNGPETVSLELCNFASLHLPPGVTELTHVTGAWSREFVTQRHRLTPGAYSLESRSVQTSHHTNPFFLINRPGQAWEENGVVYFGQLAYSGSWHITFEQLPTRQSRVHAGYNPFDFQLDLAPGATHTTPALICGVSPDGWGGASRRMHGFAQAYVLPSPNRENKLRPILYNSWEATYFDLSHKNQVELARKAAAIGVELFCVDDGWFGARRNDFSGLGDWVVSRDVFPDGLEPLVAEVHRLGMKFGLWVEPEMVNPNSDLYRQHPDWVLHFPGRPRTEARNQLILDFGRPEVIEYIFARLDDLVKRYAINFFKWDMNRSVSEPGSVVGKAIWRQHVAGVYDIMDRLRRNHPGLDIQSCSGGGGRVDLGILGRTDQVWVSDNTDAFDRMTIQEGFSLAYPARTMEAWVTHEKNHITRRTTPLSIRFDVAMRGVLGIGSSLNELNEAELAEYAGYIAFYKRIRPIVQTGHLYRLQRLEEYGTSIIAYVSPDGQEAVYSEVVHDYQVGSFRPPAPLKGLNPGAVYQVFGKDGEEVYRGNGYELMTLGLPEASGQFPGYGRTLHLKQIH